MGIFDKIKKLFKKKEDKKEKELVEKEKIGRASCRERV